MSKNFGAYARYYELLYKDKDYTAEAKFIEGILRQYAPNAVEVLELGCGTGAHAALLADQGYMIHGIDLSDTMLSIAHQRLKSLPPRLAQRLKFSQGNARNCVVDQNFDAVLSLFHVVSYQTTNDDLSALIKNASNHLKPGGVFIFDYWFGPAVLTHRPTVRIKRLESDETQITRLAEPYINIQTNSVDVNYQMLVRDKLTGSVSEISENHRMRYLFLTEIDLLARAAGLTMQASGEWLTDRAPSQDSWGVYSVLRK